MSSSDSTLQRGPLFTRLARIAGISVAFFLAWYIVAGPILKNEKLLAILLRENRIMEILSALLFLAAGVVGTRACWRLRGELAGWSRLLVLSPFAGFFCFMEETAFGYEIYKYYQKPRLFGKKIDSVHDIVAALAREFVAAMPRLALVIVGVVILIAAVAAVILLRNALFSLAFTVPTFLLMGAAAVCLVIPTMVETYDEVLGNKVEEFGLLILAEETMEYLAALMVLFSAISIPLSRRIIAANPALNRGV